MRITRLRVTNLRAIEAAEFRFQTGFNLIVGVNGAGKTSVLDALAVCLSGIVKHANRLRSRAESFLTNDIRVGAQALTAACRVQLGDSEYEYLVHKLRESSGPQAQKTGMPREQVIDTPDKAEFIGNAPKPGEVNLSGGRPIGVLFSTRRAVASDRATSTGAAGGSINVAYADALADRELRLADFAAWMRAQKALRNEKPETVRVLEAFENATRRFLRGYSNIRVIEEDQSKLVVDHGEKESLPVENLSDAERGQLREALRWADDWLKLNWEPAPGMTETQLSEAFAEKQAAIQTEALTRFLPNSENLRPDPSHPDTQLIDRKPITIEVRSLSDGERGTLAMVLDITRRLAQANPTMTDPAAEAEAVVLIDEIDLHLHPKWQRQIVQNLTAVFPKCQFIATTHSPQVIGEVEHDRIQIIANGQVYSPTHSFGVDSSRVLEEIMETGPRTEEVEELLSRLSRAIGDENYRVAHELLADLTAKLGENDPEVTRTRTLLEFMEGEK